MTNVHKGDVAAEIDGAGYTLRFSVDALCQLESAAGKSFADIGRDLSTGKISITLARQLLWSALREHHPAVTLKEAGEMIKGLGGITGAMAKINEALVAAFPDQAAPESSERPQQPGQTNGIGPASSEHGAA